MQSFFIGVGSVIASLLPWLLAKAGVGNTAGPGEVPDTVRYAFYFGGAVLLAAIGWTVLRTREYPPETLQAWDEAPPLPQRPRDAARMRAATAWRGWRSAPPAHRAVLQLRAGQASCTSSPA